MRRRTAIAFAVLLAACLRQPPRPSFDDAAITMACTDQAQAECARRASCSYLGFSVTRDYGDYATCVARSSIGCISNLHVTDTGQTADHVESCAQAYASDSCSDLFDNNPPSRCASPIGPGEIGSPCSVASQCKTGFCPDADHQLCGTCQPLPDLGAPCTTSSDCGRDAACPIPSGATSGVCTAFVTEGMPCLTGTRPCAATLVCVGDDPSTSTMGTCMPGVRQVGAACDTSRAMPTCDPLYGLACIVATGTIGTCQPIYFAQTGGECGAIGSGTMKMIVDCANNGQCVKSQGSGLGICVAAVPDGGACTLTGPPCLTAATCVVGADGMSGTCETSDPARCF